MAGREALRTLDLRIQADLTGVQRQLLQVQELTGQSQSRLSEMKAALDQRAEQTRAGPAAPIPPRRLAPFRPVGRRCRPPIRCIRAPRPSSIAAPLHALRRGFQEMVRTYPTRELVPEALFYIAESFATEAPDSGRHLLHPVLSRFPRALKASTSLYKLGRLESAEEFRGGPGLLRPPHQGVSRSDEVDLARDALKNLRP